MAFGYVTEVPTEVWIRESLAFQFSALKRSAQISIF